MYSDIHKIPTERCHVLKTLSVFNDYKATSEIAMACKLPTAMTSRVLNDLAALGAVDRIDKVTAGSNTDKWSFPDGEFKDAFLVAIHYEILSLDGGMLRGVFRDDVYVDLISYVYHNYINKYKEKIEQAYMRLYESHPSTFTYAVTQKKRPQVESPIIPPGEFTSLAQALKLTEIELKLCRTLHELSGIQGKCELKHVVNSMSLSRGRVHQLIHGRKDRPESGLLYKVKGLHVERRTIKTDDYGSTTKNYYSLSGFDALGSYSDVVSISEEAKAHCYQCYPTVTSLLPKEKKNSRHTVTTVTLDMNSHKKYRHLSKKSQFLKKHKNSLSLRACAKNVQQW